MGEKRPFYIRLSRLLLVAKNVVKEKEGRKLTNSEVKMKRKIRIIAYYLCEKGQLLMELPLKFLRKEGNTVKDADIETEDVIKIVALILDIIFRD